MKMVKGILVFAVMSSVSSVVAADGGTAFKDVEGELSMMVLGSGGPIATKEGRASAGYLIFTDGKPRILMDVGGGTYQRLAESGTNIKDLDTILLSHLHADHTGDLTSVMKTVYFHNNLARAQAFRKNRTILPGRTAPINIYGPAETALPSGTMGTEYMPGVTVYPSTTDYADDHYSLPGGVERYLKAFVAGISDDDGPFNSDKKSVSKFAYTATDLNSDWRPMVMVGGVPTFNPASRPEVIIPAAGDTTWVEGDLKVTSLAVNHGPVPAVAFRIEYKGHSIVYTGDASSKLPKPDGTSIPDFRLKQLAAGADILIYDAAITDTMPTNPLFHLLHTEPSLIGSITMGNGVGTLLLSHLTPVSSPAAKMGVLQDAVVAGGSTAGEIKVAADLQVYNLGSDD